MSGKERTMSVATEKPMFLYKAGRIGHKDKEQMVICKLVSRGVGECPEVHIFTDGSEEPKSMVKVNSFAAVQEGGKVPKIVKAKYDNYICIPGSGSGSGVKHTYLRTNTREQRDEWCSQLQDLMSIKTTPNQQHLQPSQPSQPHRERTQTDASSRKPPVSRTRRGAPTTAPGSMQEIFHDELDKVFKKRGNSPEPNEETNDIHVCCERHHFEAGAPHDARCQVPYENVHNVQNKDDWLRQQRTSKQALKTTKEMYYDFHLTVTLQEKPDQFENDYEILELRREPLPESDISGCSNSSEEFEGGASAMSAPQSLNSCNEPTEDSWPASPTSSDDSDPECSERNPPSSKTCTREPPGGRLPDQKEPEAGLCLNDQIYVNEPVSQRLPGIDARTTTHSRPASVRNDAKPTVPPRKSGLSSSRAKSVPPEPMEKTPATKIATQYKKLKREKLSETATVRVAKTIIVRNLSLLLLKENRGSILVMNVPHELKDYFRVGDQWLKVNENMLKDVRFAQNCVEMADKPEIEITLRRIPFGTICHFPWTSNNVDDIGLKLFGNEIERVYPEGLAHRRGSLQSNNTPCLNSAGSRCNNVITEVNFKCVHPDASAEQVWEMIKKAGRIVNLILHPADFRTVQRGYDENDVYEEMLP